MGLPKPKPIQGHSFAGGVSERRNAFFEYPGSPERSGPCGVSNGPWKLLYYPTEHGYVLVNSDIDPAGGTNLAGDTRCAAVDLKLKQALYGWLPTTGTHRAPRTSSW